MAEQLCRCGHGPDRHLAGWGLCGAADPGDATRAPMICSCEGFSPGVQIIYGDDEPTLEEALDTPEKRDQFQNDLTDAMQREIDEEIARQTWWERRRLWILHSWHERVRNPLRRLWHRWRCWRGHHDPTEAYGPTDCWWCDEPLVLGRAQLQAQLDEQQAVREDQEFEKRLAEEMAKAVTADIDLVMVTPCVICGVIGYGHMGDEPPEGCTGFVMPEDPDAEPADL